MSLACRFRVHKWERRSPVYKKRTSLSEFKEQCTRCQKIRYQLVAHGASPYGGDYFYTIPRFTAWEALENEVTDGMNWIQR